MSLNHQHAQRGTAARLLVQQQVWHKLRNDDGLSRHAFASSSCARAENANALHSVAAVALEGMTAPHRPRKETTEMPAPSPHRLASRLDKKGISATKLSCAVPEGAHLAAHGGTVDPLDSWKLRRDGWKLRWHSVAEHAVTDHLAPSRGRVETGTTYTDTRAT